jgi:hypothetical protein
VALGGLGGSLECCPLLQTFGLPAARILLVLVHAPHGDGRAFQSVRMRLSSLLRIGFRRKELSHVSVVKQLEREGNHHGDEDRPDELCSPADHHLGADHCSQKLARTHY